MIDYFDVLLVADPSFSGGSSAALITDVEAFLSLGAKVGLLLVKSNFLVDVYDRPNKIVLDLCDRSGVTAVRPGASAKAEIIFFHHPLPFYHGTNSKSDLRADNAVLIVHHPPFRGDGSMEYNPLSVQRAILCEFGQRPLWAPVSGAVRTQLRSFAPLLRMTSEDWVNAFDAAAWSPSRPVFDGESSVVGRHGRPHPLKWPDRAADVAASLQLGDSWKTRIMGFPTELAETYAIDTTDWDVLEFNGEPVSTFLNKLDVFSYFYSDLWFEAFGRTVTEAMLMKRPCIVDLRLRDTFGNLAFYCSPSEVADLANRLRDHPDETRRTAAKTRDKMIKRYDTDRIEVRLKQIARDKGTVSRTGPKGASPLQVIRKSIGLARRRRAGIER